MNVEPQRWEELRRHVEATLHDQKTTLNSASTAVALVMALSLAMELASLALFFFAVLHCFFVILQKNFVFFAVLHFL